MTEGGDIDKLVRGTVWGGSVEPCLHQNHVFAVRCSPGLMPDYLAAWLTGPTAREYFYLTAKKTTNLASTNSTTVGQLPIMVPSIDVQVRLLNDLASAQAPLTTTVGRIEREIALLQEFRTRLVADVVTGQVDVRAVAATLPDAPESVTDLAADFDDNLADALAETDG